MYMCIYTHAHTHVLPRGGQCFAFSNHSIFVNCVPLELQMFSTNPCCENEVEAIEREGAITLPAVTHLLFKKEKGVERLIDGTSVKINEVML